MSERIIKPRKGSLRDLVPATTPSSRQGRDLTYPILRGIWRDTRDGGAPPQPSAQECTISANPITLRVDIEADEDLQDLEDCVDQLCERRLVHQLRRQLLNRGVYAGIDASQVAPWRALQWNNGGALTHERLLQYWGKLRMMGGKDYLLLLHGEMGVQEIYEAQDGTRLTRHSHPCVAPDEAMLLDSSTVARITACEPMLFLQDGRAEAYSQVAMLLTMPCRSGIIQGIVK